MWPSAWIELRDRLLASDPGLLGVQRGARGLLAFALTVLMARGVSLATGQSAMSMALGFSVSVFGAVVPREVAPRARLISTLSILAAAGTSFTLSALIRSPWVNHVVFVALVFVVVYARRWGDRANGAGFGAFTSFFFAAFLAPPAAAISWHLLGLAIAAVAILLVQFILLPQRPAASLARARQAITRRLALLLRPIESYCRRGRWDEMDRGCLKRQLTLLEATINTARAQLDALAEGWRVRTRLSFALFELETAGERLVWVALRSDASACTPETLGWATALRARLSMARWVQAGALPAPTSPLGAALDELARVFDRLRQLCADPSDPSGRAPLQNPDDPRPASPELPLHIRLAIQASAACSLAILGGELLSPQRWYWAVITVFVLFTGTASRGDALYKSLQRLLGTFLGVFAGIGLNALVGNDPKALFALLLLSIFFTYFFFTDHFVAMTFFLTLLIGLMFAVLGRFSKGLLWLRLGETAVGAVAGIVVASLLVPRGTHRNIRARFGEFVDALAEFANASLDRLTQGQPSVLAEQSRRFEAAYQALRAALPPLRLNPFGKDARSFDVVTGTLRDCSYWLHELSLAGSLRVDATNEALQRELDSERERFGRRLRFLRERQSGPGDCADLTSNSTEALEVRPGRDAGFTLERLPHSSDERLRTAALALRHISAGLSELNDVLRGPSSARGSES